MFTPELDRFVPMNFNGCVLWVDASKHSGVLSQPDILDYSGNGKTLASSSSGVTVVRNVINGKSVFRFSGGAKAMTAAALYTDDRWTIVAVLMGAAQINKGIIAQNSSGAGRTNFLGTDGTTGTTLRLFYNNGSTQGSIGTTVAFDSKPHIAVSANSGDGVYGHHVALDGSAREGVGTGQTNTPSNVQFSIGGTTDGATFFTGDIAEILCYNTMLEPEQILLVQRYLSRKWRIAIR